MLKPFVSFLLLLALMIIAVAAHFLLFPHEKHSRTMMNFSSLTRMGSLSLSLSYDESSFNRTYPEMPTLGKMDFLYAQ